MPDQHLSALPEADSSQGEIDSSTYRSHADLSSIDANVSRPLCVDLDGTLIRTDSLLESFLSLIAHRDRISKLSRLLTANRSTFKQRIDSLAELSADTLPFNAELIEFLRKQKRNGQRVVLVTTADGKTARTIAEHLGLFDDIVASHGLTRFEGEARAAELVRRYGRKGFDYAGDSRADLPVWREARGIVLVNVSQGVARQARKLGGVIAEFDSRCPVIPTAIRAMRPHQWVKNLLVFVPLFASRSLADWSGLLPTIEIFVCFCAAASGIYLINDLLDLATDRRHPRKRDRPFASGRLSVGFGTSLAATLVATGIALALAAGAAQPLLIYIGISFAYSVTLKTYPLVDVFILAALYTLRIVAGGVASGHQVTLWLLAFSGFTFLGLALVKRAGELIRLRQVGSHRSETRRGYRLEDIPVIQMFGVSSAFASSVVLALFVNSTAAAQQYNSPELLWALVPLILFWQLRLWLSTERGQMHDDPIVYAFGDWVSWIFAACVVIIVSLASSGPRLW
jgi:4-hydroxybenzoate polyprenyltransferase/phosphoserine phosphatase